MMVEEDIKKSQYESLTNFILSTIIVAEVKIWEEKKEQKATDEKNS